MAEYIKKKDLVKFACRHVDGKLDANDIARFPTADVVPVVRCKDCKHWNKTDTDIIVNIDYGKCTNSNSPYHNEEETTGGDYCSYGERRCEERETENKPSMD